jgi:purine-binding chemotaxis protein CheW
MNQMVKPQLEAAHGQAQLLAVQLGAQQFALDIQSIREIRGWIATTHLAHAPDYVKGMINLRGAVLLVISLAERLGLPSEPPHPASVIVVVEAGEQIAGLLVDAVCDIITATPDMRRATPKTGTAASDEFVEGLITKDEQIIGIINIAAIMPDVGDLGEASSSFL